jgi:hypothetical protein
MPMNGYCSLRFLTLFDDVMLAADVLTWSSDEFEDDCDFWQSVGTDTEKVNRVAHENI